MRFPRPPWTLEEAVGLFPWTQQAKTDYYVDKNNRRLRVIMDILNGAAPLPEIIDSLVSVCAGWNEMDAIAFKYRHSFCTPVFDEGHYDILGIREEIRNDMITWGRGLEYEYNGLGETLYIDEERDP